MLDHEDIVDYLNKNRQKKGIKGLTPENFEGVLSLVLVKDMYYFANGQDSNGDICGFLDVFYETMEQDYGNLRELDFQIGEFIEWMERYIEPVEYFDSEEKAFETHETFAEKIEDYIEKLEVGVNGNGVLEVSGSVGSNSHKHSNKPSDLYNNIENVLFNLIKSNGGYDRVISSKQLDNTMRDSGDWLKQWFFEYDNKEAIRVAKDKLTDDELKLLGLTR